MPEEKNAQTGQEAVLIEKVERLSARVKETEDLRKRLYLTSLAGILLLILVLLLFFVRLAGHFRGYYDAMQDPVQRGLMVRNLLDESQAQTILAAEGQELLRQCRDELYPVVREQLVEALKEAVPELEKRAADMGTRLQAYTRNSVEKKLADAMVNSLMEVEVELQHIFPEFKMDTLQERMNLSKEEFVSQLHDVLEERIAKVMASVEALQATALEFADAKEIAGLTREEVEAQFIDVLLELIAFELTPKLGSEPVK